MKRSITVLLFVAGLLTPSYGQANFLVSCPSELKMEGMQSFYYVSHQSYLIYNPNTSTLKVIIDMHKLLQKNQTPESGQQIEYNTNIEDTNSLIFEGQIEEKKIRPTSNLQDTYTFSLNGTVKFREVTYLTQAVCSYGARMIRNNSQVALNVNIEITKMDFPMYIPLLGQMIDNLKIEIVDGTVNMVQN